jgi:hypothetical protein
MVPSRKASCRPSRGIRRTKQCVKTQIHVRMRCYAQSVALRGSGHRSRTYGNSYSANRCWLDCRMWESGSARQMCWQRQNPHHPRVSTLRLGHPQAPSQVPATILLTREGFCQRVLDMAVSLEHAVRVSHSSRVLTSMSTPSDLQNAFLFHRAPIGLNHSKVTRVIVGHPKLAPATRIEVLLLQVVAVSAIQVCRLARAAWP